MKTKALYAGSFDPFTKGHGQIVLDALKIFDEITILIAINPSKKRRFDFDESLNAIKKVFSDYRQVKVEFYSGFIADYCKDNNINFSIRGLRNFFDFEYEENIAKINAELNPNIKTIYLRTSNEIISSSMVWDLYSNGKDISKYVPQEIFDYMTSKKSEIIKKQTKNIKKLYKSKINTN
ncbi:MAG: pantetheine-phosphate adenylyltransferase [Clostridia bacterium]|nr:pantetheine-phosphate adenylyltransferase [Clostridia bacterium]